MICEFDPIKIDYVLDNWTEKAVTSLIDVRSRYHKKSEKDEKKYDDVNSTMEKLRKT